MRTGYEKYYQWFSNRSWKPFPFQETTWEAYAQGKHGLINAPTGSGKTYSLMIPILEEIDREQPKGLCAIWLSPIRALTKEIHLSATRVVEELNLNVTVGVRTGDTDQKTRARIKKEPPNILITTPESVHILMSQKGYKTFFQHVRIIVADEWHELMGSKRGVQTELAISHLRSFCSQLRVWGISATIGNMDEAAEVLLGSMIRSEDFVFIHSNVQKVYEVISVLPDDIEKFPWAGHMGIKLLHKVIPIIENSSSTLIFTNTRNQCEVWYQRLLDIKPDLAGIIAMHHSAISDELRAWVEEALHDGRLKAVVCTSSLDLGVDFRPVESIVQIGGPKGVARFVQRAGRSGHNPGAVSRIYFVPTHALELVEGAALRFAIDRELIEDRTPHIRSFDVLIQYLMTLAVAGGFHPDEIYKQIKSTHAFSSVTEEEWQWTLDFLIRGSRSLDAYQEYQKLGLDNSGNVRVLNRSVARRHRMSIGTIVGDHAMRIRYLSGKRLGTVEESFISQLNPGDIFWFAGRSLEYIRIKGNDVIVRKSTSNKGKVPSWMGGRMPLSSQMSEVLRLKLDQFDRGIVRDIEMETLRPLLDLQKELSALPSRNNFLIEYFETREGYHLLVYPFEGRFVHEGLGSLLAYRIAQIQPMSFSIAMNDYGLELLSDQPIPVEESIDNGLFSTENLTEHIQLSINEIEMARKRFWQIAAISGLIFQGYPGKQKKDKHLRSSSMLLFNVFHDYEPDNLLYLQSYEEAKIFQFEENRLRNALNRISHQTIMLTNPKRPTPLSFPILVDRLRERMSSETLEDRIKKMQLAMKW